MTFHDYRIGIYLGADNGETLQRFREAGIVMPERLRGNCSHLHLSRLNRLRAFQPGHKSTASLLYIYNRGTPFHGRSHPEPSPFRPFHYTREARRTVPVKYLGEPRDIRDQR